MRPSPGVRVVRTDGVHPHLLLPGAGIILSAALTLNHSKGLRDSVRQQWQANKMPGTAPLRSRDGQRVPSSPRGSSLGTEASL